MKEDLVKKIEDGNCYYDRELSWLRFNRRVLDQANLDKYPLLERLRFLAYVSSNLDEFFEIRVAGLMQEMSAYMKSTGAESENVKKELSDIRESVNEMVNSQYKCWNKRLLPELEKEKIFFKQEEDLSKEEFKWLEKYYEEQVLPVLTPLAVDPSHPFPHLTNKALYILVGLKDPKKKGKEDKMAIIPVPRILPRLIRIETGDVDVHYYIFLAKLVRIFAKKLFPDYEVIGGWAFRVTRNSDFFINEEEMDNLLSKIEEELHKSKKGAAVRLEIRKNVDPHMLSRLLDCIGLTEDHVYKVDEPINLMRLMKVCDQIDRPDLRFKPMIYHIPEGMSDPKNIFTNISNKDHLLHHPYDSFHPVVNFIKQAAKDPNVFAIKQTLYRTSGDTAIVEALKEASINGKQVTVLVELKARFDEANNIQWARELEDMGVHVLYGLLGLKTHCKVCLVVRREGDVLRRYAHLGTGNYNVKTARTYTDLSLFTSDESITNEVSTLFNNLTGFASKPKFGELWIAPFNLQMQLLKSIDREIGHAKEGKPARVFAKLNSLVDPDVISRLYLASQNGVNVELLVRGICCLVPGIKGLSENIRVFSILGRFLEHSRIYFFENGENESSVYVGSSDWMPRNFQKRVELVFPIKDTQIKKRIINKIIAPYLKDDCYAVELQSDGNYVSVNKGKKKSNKMFSAQEYFIEDAAKKMEKMKVVRSKKK